MNKAISWIGTVVVAAGVTGVSQAAAYNLGDLLTTGNSITIGDKIFDDFTFDSSQVDPSSAVVIPSVDAAGVYYLTISGPFVVWAGNSSTIGLGYSVSTTSGQKLIASIDQSFVLSAGGTGGTINISEKAFDGSLTGPLVATSNLSFTSGLPPTVDLEDPSTETGDDLVVENGSNKLFVWTDIYYQASRAGIIGPSVLTQSFHQNQMVSDNGTTAALMGVALLSMGYFRRKNR
jgi:hypothetical protein